MKRAHCSLSHTLTHTHSHTLTHTHTHSHTLTHTHTHTHSCRHQALDHEMENRRALLALLPDDTLLQHLNVDPKWDEANTVLSDAVGCLMLLVPVAPAHSLALFVSALSLAVSRLPIPHSRAPLTLQVLCGCQRLFSADVLTKGLWRGALMMMRFCTRSLLPLGPHLLICEPVFCVYVCMCASPISLPRPSFPWFSVTWAYCRLRPGIHHGACCLHHHHRIPRLAVGCRWKNQRR